MAKSLSRFDGAAIWETLSPEAQAAIGAAALELVAMWSLEERTYEDADQLPAAIMRVSKLGDVSIVDALGEAFVEAVDRDALADDEGCPLVPTLLGRVCRYCGCTDDDGCDPRCGWAEPDLCTGCSPLPHGEIVNVAGSGPEPIALRGT